MQDSKIKGRRLLLELVLILVELVSFRLLSYPCLQRGELQIIENKAKPLGTHALLLKKEMTIGKQDEDGATFGNIGGIGVASDGRMIVLDSKVKKIKIFDSSGKLVKEFGQEGQGPGEWVMPVGLQVIADKRLIISDVGSHKLLYLDLEGNFLEEISYAKRPTLMKVIEFWDRFLATEMAMEGTSLAYNIAVYDKTFDQIFKIDSLLVPLPLGGTKINPFNVIFDYCLDDKGNIVFGRGIKYEIKFFTREGNLFKIIRKEYKPQAISEKDKLEILQMLPETAGINIKELVFFPENFPAFSSFFLDEKGWLYVRTYQKGKFLGSYIVDIFSREGIFMTSCEIPGIAHVWKNGKLYTVEKDSEDNQYVCRYNSNWSKRDS